MDLALDLVLNDVVEQARTVTGATGAAIALFRDGELTCRATSGENAPDLGVRVDGTSGLAGACVSSGEIQQCQDTETDPRVNPEACRRLGVRSMLIAPLVDGQRLIGIIQVFSAWPNAFGKREFSALQVLAGRIAESNREAEAGMPVPMEQPEALAEPAEMNVEPIPDQQDNQPTEESLVEPSISARAFDLWNTVLVVLVIGAAIALGLAIGWRKAAEFTKRPAAVKTSAPVNTSSDTAATSTGSQNRAAEDSGTGPHESIDASTVKARTAAPLPPPGGLIVTQNGKVVYRTPSAASSATTHGPSRSLIHKVDPEYPAEAKARRIQGPVVLDVQVLEDGAVGTIAVVSGDPALTPSAINAVKQWRYQPAPANGKAIESQTRVTVKFTLPGS
ncbi:MAG TPA: TonB family protein [Terriglobales bacterium]|nr:TonB family protein [Terriglobales bacterium]